MTYNLLNDADQCQSESYESLLVNLYNFLSQKQDCSDFDKKLKEKIIETYKILKSDSDQEKKFAEDFANKSLFKDGNTSTRTL